jgi:hypothetical protein
MAAGGPYAAIDAFLTEHRLCRPGLDDPDVSDAGGALVFLRGEDCRQAAAGVRVRLSPG